MGERSLNRISQTPVLKKVRMRDIIGILPFYFDRLLKNSTNCHSRPCFRRGKLVPAKVGGGSEAPRPHGGASRKGNIALIVPLDPTYKAGLRGTCRPRILRKDWIPAFAGMTKRPEMISSAICQTYFQPAFSSEVQLGQRVACIGIFEKQ